VGKSHLYITSLAIALASIPNLSEVFSQGILQSNPSNLSLTSDTGIIAWGERAEITLRLGKGINETMEDWPQWQDTIPGGLEILHTSLLDTLAPENSDPDEWDMIMEQSWVVTGWDSGYVLIPSIKLGRDSTSPFSLQIIVPTMTEGELEIMPAADIIQIEWSVYERFIKATPWIGGLFGLVILFFIAKFVYLWWRNRVVGEELIEEIKPYIPPHITAMKELKTLEDRQSWNKGEAKTFHVQLSKIIRTYIDGRFHISSLEKTTREISELINTLDIHTSDKSKLMLALRLGDQIKFAKRQALSEEHARSVSVCIEFVQNTMERPEEGASSKEAKE
jgi:hypothetical protein